MLGVERLVNDLPCRPVLWEAPVAPLSWIVFLVLVGPKHFKEAWVSLKLVSDVGRHPLIKTNLAAIG